MLNLHDPDMKCFNFPAGEMHVVLPERFKRYTGSKIDIQWVWRENEDIVKFLLVLDALSRIGKLVDTIVLPYVPFAPQDRINQFGEPLSIKVFADVINSANASRVVITDPHSDVTKALINNCVVIEQHELFSRVIDSKYQDNGYFLISPDGGALKKIYKLMEACRSKPVGVVECSKQRNTKTGAITNVNINGWSDEYSALAGVLVDDICFGGRTAMEIGKQIHSLTRGASPLIFMVSHGFFTSGMEQLNVFDEIYTRIGRVK